MAVEQAVGASPTRQRNLRVCTAPLLCLAYCGHACTCQGRTSSNMRWHDQHARMHACR